jgi:type I site-specific restriction endonuclease
MGQEGKKPTVVGAQARAYVLTLAFERCSIKLEPDIREMEAAADLFIESTEGYLKMVEIVTKRDYEQLAGLHEYFKEQLKDVREVANLLAKFPPTFERARGISQDLTATINRQTTIWRAEVAVMRKVETHCARMVKATQDYFDRSILKASQELLSTLQDIVKLMAAD